MDLVSQWIKAAISAYSPRSPLACAATDLAGLNAAGVVDPLQQPNRLLLVAPNGVAARLRDIPRSIVVIARFRKSREYGLPTHAGLLSSQHGEAETGRLEIPKASQTSSIPVG
ncbi:hypothetical protein [Bradyrhizobium nanningense]|uniref:hypothetical protein n=1 Tax=Bradyrhizobium nanningense TaxID=1325118 RepID=UPI001008AFF9|nr:hypothetical protein [Bradyrhizobium nanningense]